MVCIKFKSKFTETVTCISDEIINGNTLSIVSMSLDTLFNIRPIGVVLNRLSGFLKIRELINLYNFSAANIVPNDKVIDAATVEKTKKNIFNYHKYDDERFD